jgi:hypothetical protein
MNYEESEKNHSVYQSNIRAEDRPWESSGWNYFYEAIAIPCGFIAALFLIGLIVILIRP